jgi:hypothetical protein
MEETKIRNARVLVVVKAYPNPSRGYQETVCTAGLLDGTRWIRIYPVPYRFLRDEAQYPKYGWIELDLERRYEKDFRPESYRLLRGEQEPIKLIGQIKPTHTGWEERRRHVLALVYTSMSEIIADAYGPEHVSIAVLKPKEIIDVTWTVMEEEEAVEPLAREPELFDDEGSTDQCVRPVRPLPVRFYYVFTTTDGVVRQLMIEDWEIGALYWNCLDRSGDQADAIEKVKAKCLSLARDRDLHLVLGTILRNHRKQYTNPFVIIGLFYPPKVLQYSLFDDQVDP